MRSDQFRVPEDFTPARVLFRVDDNDGGTSIAVECDAVALRDRGLYYWPSGEGVHLAPWSQVIEVWFDKEMTDAE